MGVDIFRIRDCDYLINNTKDMKAKDLILKVNCTDKTVRGFEDLSLTDLIKWLSKPEDNPEAFRFYYEFTSGTIEFEIKQIKELEEQIDEQIIINQNLHNLNTCSSCKKLKVVLD